jgi:sterol desaturase/sphingolipid hydroxylase (fatty acid hydroxylase superfamily)
LLSSIPLRSAQLFVIGPSERTVIAYELLMQLASMFYHSDLDLGARADAVAGRLLMTPRLHTRHHSATRAERDCNWGVVSSIWDRLFGTFDARAARDPRLGVGSERKIEALHLRRLLSLPRRSRFD